MPSGAPTAKSVKKVYKNIKIFLCKKGAENQGEYCITSEKSAVLRPDFPPRRPLAAPGDNGCVMTDFMLE
jgi:hypothetical protein